MQIQYLGHSSFRIKTKTATLVTDPFSEKIGFKLPKVEADIVTISHDHFDHNYSQGITGNPFIISGPGEYEIKEIGIRGLPTYHDDQKGEKKGDNTVFVINAEDLCLCHLGDLGHKLSSKQVEEMGEVDVLFVPVGGVTTLGPEQAVAVVAQIEPHLVIPMHYKTSRHYEKFSKRAGVDIFLKELGVEKRQEEKLVIAKPGLGEEMEVVVLKEKT